MKSASVIRERYLRDPLPVRLGGLAANLARVESFSGTPENGAVVERLIEESTYFIEWTAPDAQLEVQEQLVGLQHDLVRWRRAWEEIWSDPERRAAMAREAGRWSGRLLELSGLLSAGMRART